MSFITGFTHSKEIKTDFSMYRGKFAFTLAESVKDAFHMRQSLAFTLAEVLITLGIIGVVAALTLPALTAKYQKKVTAVRIKKAYSDISQAIQMSTAENGDYKNWNFGNGTYKQNTLNFMDKYMLPYLKNINYCDDGNSYKCGTPVSGDGQNYIFNSGVGFSILATGNEAPLLIDINGPGKPNIIGIDVFYYNIADGKLIPYGWKEGLTREDVINGITDENGLFFACKTPPSGDLSSDSAAAYYLYMCPALLLIDGWEIKDDYPWVR